MQLEQQVVSLKLAEKLKNLGVKQESLFFWGTWGGGKVLGELGWKGEFPDDPNSYCSAFTAVRYAGSPGVMVIG